MRPSPALLKSARSAWKGPYYVQIPGLTEAKERRVAITTKARNCAILPNMVDIIFNIHNGKDYITVKITQDMIGHKLGEFASTKKKWSWLKSEKKR